MPTRLAGWLEKTFITLASVTRTWSYPGLLGMAAAWTRCPSGLGWRASLGPLDVGAGRRFAECCHRVPSFGRKRPSGAF